MKKLIALITVAVALVGCEKLEGQLNVTNDVQLVNSKGDKRVVRVGTYSADVSANTSKKITLRLNNDNSEKYVFNVPNGSIPSNGAFTYKAATLGQPVDLTGVVATNVRESDRKQGMESCQYQTPVTVCAPAGPQGQVVCTTRYQTVFGNRFIQYVDRTTTKDLTLKIAAAGTGVESADFSGSSTWSERVVLSQGVCR